LDSFRELAALGVCAAGDRAGLRSGTGWWQAREKSAHIQSELGSRYVQSLDPYRKMQM